MALLKFKNDFSDDMEHFKDLYECTPEQFISGYSDNIEIDLTGKVVVAVEAPCLLWGKATLPINILAIFIPEEEKYSYKATLIYSGHIAFLQIKRTDGKIQYFYKDDECYPQTYTDFERCESECFYECKENGFEDKDILKQIEMQIQVSHDFKFKAKPENLIILEGL